MKMNNWTRILIFWTITLSVNYGTGKVKSIISPKWYQNSERGSGIPISPIWVRDFQTTTEVNHPEINTFPPMESNNDNKTNINIELKSEDLSIDYTSKYCRCVTRQYCSTNNKIRQERAVNIPFCHDGQVMCCSTPRVGCGVVDRFPDFSPYPDYGEASFGEYPWTALILDSSSDIIYGTGIIVSWNLVITAARNVYPNLGKRFRVRLGEWDLASDVEPFEEQEFFVQETVIHPSFDPKTYQNDIVLLRLNSTINLDSIPNIRSLCLPRPGDDFKFTNARCISAGWGSKPDARIVPGRNLMKEVDLQILDAPLCQRAIRRVIENPDYYWDDQSFLCAGGQQGKGLCKGDEGAALICQDNRASRFIAVGMSSWGTTCGQGGFPGVFTNLATYYNWIKSVEPGIGQ